MSSFSLKKWRTAYLKMSVQARAAIWYTVCNIIQKGLVFLTTPIFSRLLTTEEFGLFNVFTTWQSILIIFVSLNLASGVFLRGLIKYEEDAEEFSTSLYSLFTAVFFAGFLIYLAGSGLWNRLIQFPTPYMICMFMDMLAATAFHFWSSRQRVYYQYRSLILITILNAIIKPGLGIVSILLSDDPLSARIYSMTAADLLCFGWFFISMWTGKRKKISTKYWRYALNYNLPLVPHYLSQIILNQSDRLMINYLVGESSAGIYSLAYTLASIVLVLNQAILNSYNPWMYRQIKDEKYGSIGNYSMGLLLLVAAANFCVILLAPELIFIMAPASYREAIWLMPPVTMSIFFMFMYSLFANFEFYYEKTKYMMAASVSGALLNILLNYIFIQRFGYIAAGYTTLVCYVCYCIAHYLLMRKILKENLPDQPIYNIRKIILLSIAFLASGFSIMPLYSLPIARYALFLVLVGILIHFRRTILSLIKIR